MQAKRCTMLATSWTLYATHYTLKRGEEEKLFGWMEFSFQKWAFSSRWIHFLVFYVTPNSRLWAIYPFKGIPVGEKWGKLKRMLVNRPGVARAALQSQSETMSHVSHVACHVSHVTCHLSPVRCPLSQCHFFSSLFFIYFFLNPLKKFDKVVELIGGGSVISGVYPV